MRRLAIHIVWFGLAACATAPRGANVIDGASVRQVTLAQLAAAQTKPRAATYRLGGARALRPASVSDDGRSMMIEWGVDTDLPAVFAVNAHGDEFLPITMMRSDRMIIDAVYPLLVFRIDGQRAWAKRVVRRVGS